MTYADFADMRTGRDPRPDVGQYSVRVARPKPPAPPRMSRPDDEFSRGPRLRGRLYDARIGCWVGVPVLPGNTAKREARALVRTDGQGEGLHLWACFDKVTGERLFLVRANHRDQAEVKFVARLAAMGGSLDEVEVRLIPE